VLFETLCSGVEARTAGDDLSPVIERIADLRGRRLWILEVPVLTPRLSSLWVHLVTAVSASVARPLIEGLKSPTVAREERLRTLVPELTSFDTARSAFAP